jgi:hypothetical protein
MTDGITTHEGVKYLRRVNSSMSDDYVLADVYAVLEAFDVRCPARAHAVKKLLCCGSRGKGDELADLVGAQAAVSRAIELQTQRERSKSDDRQGHSES